MYNIEVKIEGLQKRRKSSGLLHIVAGFFLIATASQYYKLSGYQSLGVTLLAFLTAIISLGYGIFRNRLDAEIRYNVQIRLLQAATFFILTLFSFSIVNDVRSYSLLLWTGICVALMITERKLFQNPLLTIHSQHISLPGYAWNKEILWSQVQNIIIRLDFVTIYYPDNRFIQYEVSNNFSNTELEKINFYCQQQLTQTQQ